MRNHIFIDSLNALASDLDTKLFHLLTRNRKLSDQLDTLAMHLLDFKTTLYQNMSKFIGDCLTQNNAQSPSFLSQTLERLTQEMIANNDRLCRYRLHQILKNKAEKKRKESMLASSLSSPRNEQLTDLQKSIVMIEKDLGIERENEQNQNLAITRIISKSLLLGIDSTPISKIKAVDNSMISEAGSVEIDLVSSQLSQQSLAKETALQNEKQLQSAQKTVPLPKKVNPLKKKKPTLGKSDVREGLLGNLLEETYSQCLDKE